MNKTLIVASALALSLVSTQAFAGGGMIPNGTSHNGIATFDAGEQDQTTSTIACRNCASNGVTLNGITLNGAKLNGSKLNGARVNGTASSGARVVTYDVVSVKLPSGQRVWTGK